MGVRSPRLRFRDEFGNPSDRSGPDLSKAPPIEAVIKQLADLEGDLPSYASVFCNACDESGIFVAVEADAAEGEHLQFVFPCDGQEELRLARYTALLSHMSAEPSRRAAIGDFLNRAGRFMDRRPFATADEAIDAFVHAGGRVMVSPAGELDARIETEIALADGYETGFALRRLAQRFAETRRGKGRREALIAAVRRRGAVHEGSGFTIVEGEGAGFPRSERGSA